MPSIPRVLGFILVPTVLMSGCGEKKADTASADSAAAADSAAMAAAETDTAAAPSDTGATQPAGTSGDASSRPLTVADIERWEKGLAGEMRAVQDAAAKMKNARTQEDTLNAIMAPQESETAAAGAQAAGLDEQRYKLIRSEFSEVLRSLAPLAMFSDTTQIPPAQREEFRKQGEDYLKQMESRVPAEVVEALRPRAAELRKKDLELAGARLKAAGVAR